MSAQSLDRLAAPRPLLFGRRWMVGLPLLLASGLVFAALPAATCPAQPPTPSSGEPAASRKAPFILGADISWIPQDEAAGAKYYDHGEAKDIFVILKEHGFNYIRLRIFVDPKAPGGYAARSPEAFCDLAHTQAMAKRIKAAGMQFLLDFHLSDT